MSKVDEPNGLKCAFVLDGKGGAKRLDWDGVRRWSPDDGILWAHLDYAAVESQQWLEREAGLDAVAREALLATQPRPRAVLHDDGLLFVIRGINHNEGADPEDMVSVRAWADPHRLITMRHRRVKAAKKLRNEIAGGKAPHTVGELVVELTDRMLDYIGRVVEKLDDVVARLEDEMVVGQRERLRVRLAETRRQAIGLHRYLAPQRDALARLQNEQVPWLSDLDRVRLREHADRMTRFIEDLDAARDRAAITQEELSSRMSEQMNRRLYVLSMVTTVFLPLGLITGLLGVNLGGIPGTRHPWGFAALCVGVLLIAGAQLWVLRRRKWL